LARYVQTVNTVGMREPQRCPAGGSSARREPSRAPTEGPKISVLSSGLKVFMAYLCLAWTSIILSFERRCCQLSNACGKSVCEQGGRWAARAPSEGLTLFRAIKLKQRC